MPTIAIIGVIVLVVFVLLLFFIRQIDQYERGIVFTMGKFMRIWQPGWHLIVPIFQRVIKVDIRVKAVDVPDQEAITKDNIPIRINAVIYFKVNDAAKAVIEVENFFYAVSQLAQTTMRNIVGEVTLDELLANRDKIADRIREIVEKETDQWGLHVANVELKDVSLPPDMERTIAKQAEAEREKRAVIITSEGELAASQNMAAAAQTLAAVPGALHLRTLQAMNDVSSDQSNTIVFAIPLEILRAFDGFAKNQQK